MSANKYKFPYLISCDKREQNITSSQIANHQLHNSLRWILLIAIDIKSLNHGVRFVIFRTLFGTKCLFIQPLCPHNFFVHYQFALEDNLGI